MRPAGNRLNFLDATEEEVNALARSLLSELSIIASCLALPDGQKKTLKANIAAFEAYLNGRHPTH
jgi:hypothetical protein